jgi:hypothetical protein
MRDGLTALAGLVILALIVAWIAPGFIDWRQHRPALDAAMTRAFGAQVRSNSNITLRLLPSPRLIMNQLSAGHDAQTRLTIETLELELAATALLRGEVRVIRAIADNVIAILTMDAEGQVIAPIQATSPTKGGTTAIEQLQITRGSIVVEREGQAPLLISSVAAELSAPRLSGPWRINAEIAGKAIRLATGVADDTGLRLKLVVNDAQDKVELDGTATFIDSRPGFIGNGLLQLGSALQNPLIVTTRVAFDAQTLALTALGLDLPNQAGRIEGDARFGLKPGDTRQLILSTRRLDTSALRDMTDTARHLLESLGAASPLPFAFTADQLVFEGEDINNVTLSGMIDSSDIRIDAATAQFVGGTATASGTLTHALDSARGRISFAIEETRRLAITLARMGLDASAADYISGQGRSRVDADATWQGTDWSLENAIGESGGGRWSGSLNASPHRIDLTFKSRNQNLSGLPSFGNALFGNLKSLRAFTARFDLDQARLPDMPPGGIAGEIVSDGDGIAIKKLSAIGFGGVQLDISGSLGSPDARLTGSLKAPDANPLLALARPFISPETARTFARKTRLLSPLDLMIGITPVSEGSNLVLNGKIGSGQIQSSLSLKNNSTLAHAKLAYSADSTATLAAMLGLPRPAEAQGRAEFSANIDGERAIIHIEASGLSIAGDGQFSSSSSTSELQLSVRAAKAGTVLPALWAPLAPESPFAFTTIMKVADDRVSLSQIRSSTQSSANLSTITLEPDGQITGELNLSSLDATKLLSAGLGAQRITGPAGSMWSNTPFADNLSTQTGHLAVKLQRLDLGDNTTTGRGSFVAIITPDETRLDDLKLQLAGGSLSGNLRMGRSGGLGSIATQLTLTGIDLASLTDAALTGTINGTLIAGGSGESPARLMNTFAGSGEVDGNNLNLTHIDPAALARLVAPKPNENAGQEAISQDGLRRRLDSALKNDSWYIGAARAPIAITGGVLRLALPDMQNSGTNLTSRIAIDLRTMILDARASLRLAIRPKDWVGELPQAQIAWQGPVMSAERRVDVGILANSLAQRSLTREIERIDAFESDIRERAFFARRLRWEREQRMLEDTAERTRQELLKQEAVRSTLPTSSAAPAATSRPLWIVPGILSPTQPQSTPPPSP